MTTINTSDDLIRVLRENPEFRATIRRELLTTDLLEVPEQLTSLRESTAALLEHATETNRRLDQVDQQIAQMNRRLDQVDQRLDGMEGDIKIVKRDIDGLGESFRREVRAQSSFRGTYAQAAAGDNTTEVTSLFADLHGVKRIRTRRVARARLVKWLQHHSEAIEALDLRPRAWRTFQKPDIVIEVHDLFAADDADPEYYVAVEASYTADAEDILRATDHAKIVRAATGLDAYPVVAAVMLHDALAPEMEGRLYYDVDLFIEANDADAALFYRLDSADLRPLEPG